MLIVIWELSPPFCVVPPPKPPPHPPTPTETGAAKRRLARVGHVWTWGWGGLPGRELRGERIRFCVYGGYDC